MLSNYSKYISMMMIFVTLLMPQKFSSIQERLTKEQQQVITQAKALEKSGLIDEAIIAYQDILKKFPTLKVAFDKLKKICINTGKLDELKNISDQYVKSNNYSMNSKIDALDAYIITDNPEWESSKCNDS